MFTKMKQFFESGNTLKNNLIIKTFQITRKQICDIIFHFFYNQKAKQPWREDMCADEDINMLSISSY